MLISLSQPFDSLQSTCKGIKLLKHKMENPGGKRRRYTSQTSDTSTSTQFTHVSDDSSRTTSPNDVKRFGERPFFRLGSESEENPSVSATSITNRAAIERDVAYSQERRRLLAAKRAKMGRRQSDSVIENSHHHQMAPHRCHTTMCMEHGSVMDEFDVIDEETHPKCHHIVYNRLQHPSQSTSNIGSDVFSRRQNYNTNTSFDHSIFLQNKPRSNSVDALNGLRVNSPHIYDEVNQMRTIDTEIRLENTKPVVRASRKRLNSSMSESPVDRLNNELQTDSGSAYVRATNTSTQEGFCDTLCSCLKRYALLILIVLNILLLFVNFVGLPYLALQSFENSRGSSVPLQTELCFGCSEITLQDRERITDIAGVFTINDRGQCCFNTSESFTSWIVKEITSKRMFVYVKGEDIVETEGENRIRWGDSGKMGPVSLIPDRTAVVINEPGYYFLFSRVHFVKSKPSNQTSQLTLWHAIKNNRNSKRGALESTSQICNLHRNSQHTEHNSVLETIAYLRADDQVYVSIRGQDFVDRNKEHSLGLFRIK